MIMRGAVPERTKTIEEWTAEGGINIQQGESAWIVGGRGPYKLTMARTSNHTYCSCPAWTFQRLPPALRSCKHCRMVL
jgi:hypothetical protein